MEPDDLVVYNSNIAYHVCGDDVQQQYNSTTTDHNAVKTPTKATNSARASKVLSILTVILVLLILILMALSVVTITQLNSTIQRQLNKANNGVATVLTQLVITCNNISQKLFQFDTKINNLISLQLQNTDMEQQANCEPGLWHQVAHLNMSDPSQKCPSVWREYNRVRACGRPSAATGSCATKHYLISNQYRLSRVCGRVIGYQF